MSTLTTAAHAGGRFGARHSTRHATRSTTHPTVAARMATATPPPALQWHAPAHGRVLLLCPTLPLAVLSQRHEVLWPDGTCVALHPVEAAHDNALLSEVAFTLRATHHMGRWVLVDMAVVAPSVAAELRTAAPHSRPGVLMYGLRKLFSSAHEFLLAARQRGMAEWVGPARGTEAHAPEGA